MANPVRFVIFANDNPLLSIAVGKDTEETTPHLSEFIMYSALDAVDEKRNSTNGQYLKVVDKSNQYLISAYITPGNILFFISKSVTLLLLTDICFLLLHKKENEERIRQFFTEVHQLYIHCMMNPFMSYLSPIHNTEFIAKIKTLALKL